MVSVSVIMTSYNYGRYVTDAIKSVLEQTYRDLELIVIDDASSDDSAEKIERCRRADPRVRTVFHKVNKGIAATLNEGIGLASGEFVAFLSSDDIWSRDKLKEQVAVLEDNPDLAVWSEGEIINRDGKPVRKKTSGDVWRGSRLEKLMGQFNRNEDLIVWSELETLDGHGGPDVQKFTGLIKAAEKKKSGYIFNDLAAGNYILGSSLIVKKENLKGIRFNPGLKYLNDYLFYLELSRKCRFCFIDEPLIGYRLHGKNSTFRDSRGWDMDTLTMNELLLKRYCHDLPGKLMSKLLCVNALIYLKIGVTDSALKCMYRGVRTYPLHAYYVLLLVYLWVKKAYIKDYYGTGGKAAGTGPNAPTL